MAYLRSRWREDDPAATLRDTFTALDADFREGQAREHAERVRRVGQPVAGELSPHVMTRLLLAWACGDRFNLRNACVVLIPLEQLSIQGAADG